MKIRLSELRRIIREVLEEEAGVPGHLVPGSSGMSGEAVHSTEHGGMGIHDGEDDLDEEDSDL
jgi:hypothetical protein